MQLFGIPLLAVGIPIIGLAILTLIALSYRVVVSTNSVHIVQSSKARTSYGGVDAQGNARRNTYYAWPSWIPFIGVKISVLPLSVFSLPLNDYNAYDKGRLPFMIDMMAFFRINDSGMAAERVSSFKELEDQLEYILKGAARTILATSEIGEIMESRAVFGEKFTQEVEHQLVQWGVTPVKNIELMDLRDAQGSQVIGNIMAKKKSEIEKEARVTVAANMQAAQMAEIDAKRAVAINEQEAGELVGKRTAQQQQAVGISKQQAEQAVQEEAAKTAEKVMAVKQINDVRTAEIDRSVAIVAAERAKAVAITLADQRKQVAITESEGNKQQAILIADGTKQANVLEAEGIRARGEAEGAAATAIAMAPINTQIALAKEIGENEGYQKYLVGVKQIEAAQAIGVEQAKALDKAEIKMIVQAGGPAEGMKSVMDIFTPKGAATVAAAVETFRQASETGGKIIDAATTAITPAKPNGSTPARR